MYTQPRFELIGALRWTRSVFPPAIAWAGFAVGIHEGLGWHWLTLPPLPVSILGTAVAFYLGFKGNAAYDRLWEARKIWGGIVNSSRTWGSHVVSMIHDAPDGLDDTAELHRELIYRHVAWLGALRTQLRRPKPWEHRTEENDVFRKHHGTYDMSPEVLANRIRPFVADDELEWLMDRKNQATQVLATQGRRLTELSNAGRLDPYPYVELQRLIETFYTLQGKCERIKNFPLPRQYATTNTWFVKAFILAVPFALVAPFAALGPGAAWLAVPCSVALSWIFYMWDTVLDYSENPFEGMINDIPMDAMSRTIEIDLREMLGELDLPPKLEPIDGNVAV